MNCPVNYDHLISQGNLILEYYSDKFNSFCQWYQIEKDGDTFEVLALSSKKEIIAVYNQDNLIFLIRGEELNKKLLI